MRIDSVEIRACRTASRQLAASEMRFATIREIEFLVLTLRTDDGLAASTFGFAASSACAAAHIAADALKPFFLGKDPHYRERHWHDFRMADRWWNHVPIYSYGPFDIACWLLAAQAAGLPLYRYLGACRDRVPIYGSSLVLESPQAYAEQADSVRGQGWAAYKLHPPGDYAFDLEAYRLAREAVGPGFTLMADPVASHNHQSALRMGRELERLGYYWFEEPLFDADLYGLKKLREKLDIPICGTEVLPGAHYATAQCLAERCVDIVRTDASWKGGVTAVMKTAHLAEAFGVQCEVHTAILAPLELVNLHCCAAIQNCEFFEVLLPREHFEFGLVAPIEVEGGEAVLPQAPGLGIELDWDFIENSTISVL
jgi:L-alanine-DL-glutamate epimerase-like enolase superfamily enzyme